MQQISFATGLNTRLTVLSRSIAHRRSEQKAEIIPGPHPIAFPGTAREAPAGLDLIAQFVLSNTRASGVAVAILDETGLHCRASAGEAPHSGTAVRTDNTISGQCIRSGAFFHCADTLETCPKALPARSIMLLPILWGRHARGLVALFSRQPDAFNAASIAIARSATSLAAITLNACLPQLDCPIDGQVLEADMLEPPLAEAVHETPRLPAAPRIAPVLNKDHLPGRGKVVYGLPCAKCGAYFSTYEKACPLCQTPK